IGSSMAAACRHGISYPAMVRVRTGATRVPLQSTRLQEEPGMTADASRFAVFGHPIAHTLSPRIHHLFGAQLGIPVDYQAIDAAPDGFAAAVQAFFAGGGRGANVTLPHKRAAFGLAEVHSRAAERVGTANVLTPAADGTLHAHNTDG